MPNVQFGASGRLFGLANCEFGALGRVKWGLFVFVALVDDCCWKGAFLDRLGCEIRRVREEREGEEYPFVGEASWVIVEVVLGG